MAERNAAVVPMQGGAVAQSVGIDVGGGNLVSLDTAMVLAERLAGAATLPQAYKKAPDIMAAMLVGAQLKLPLMTIINGTHVINGKVCLSADLMVGACRGSGQVARWSEGEIEGGYEVSAKRTDGTELTVSFTDADAKAAGLTGGNWAKFRVDMMRARAVSRICRRLFPDVLAGTYSREEMDGDMPAGTGTITGEVIDAEEIQHSDPRTVKRFMARLGDILKCNDHDEAAALRKGVIADAKAAVLTGAIRRGGEAQEAIAEKLAEVKAHIDLLADAAGSTSEETGQQAVAAAEDADADASVTDVEFEDDLDNEGN